MRIKNVHIWQEGDSWNRICPYCKKVVSSIGPYAEKAIYYGDKYQKPCYACKDKGDKKEVTIPWGDNLEFSLKLSKMDVRCPNCHYQYTRLVPPKNIIKTLHCRKCYKGFENPN